MGKGWSFYTNGQEQMSIRQGEQIPEGWVKGRKPFSPQTRAKISQLRRSRQKTNKGMKYSDQARENMSKSKKEFLQTHPDYKNQNLFEKGRTPWNKGVPMSDQAKKKLSAARTGLHLSPQMLEQKKKKQHQTKTRNQSWNISQPEESAYKILCDRYGTDDVVRQYRHDIRYPFNCDFYVKSEDMFIECNFHWTHGGHFFDETNQEDIKKLQVWQERSKYSQFYKLAINVWTKSDKKKKEIAEKYHLNYKALYKKEDINDCI